MALFVHLVYIHGFQGDDTSFQSFPTDLHKHLSARLPNIQTSIYPTYKSAKPLSFATRNFLRWLSTQPPGAVILLGHSMGGLLAAEAATDSSNDGTTPQRIIGVVAFDTPYLGIHPHVVITGIASLLPKGDDADKGHKDVPKKSLTNKLKEMNDERHVNVVDDNITDDWEQFKKSLNLSPHHLDPHIGTSRSAPPSPNQSRSQSSRLSPLLDHTINLLSSHGNESIGRWLRKHADEPLNASRRWIVEHFQFGASMFDASGLRARYEKLAAWDGKWVNYWTETAPKTTAQHSVESAKEADPIPNEDLLQPQAEPYDLIPSASSSMVSVMSSDGVDLEHLDSEIQVSQEIEKPTETEPRQEDIAQIKDTRASEKKHKGVKKMRYFVVRPDRLGRNLVGGVEKWEMVKMEGVADEVAAHCGIFIRGQNLDYEGLIARVGQKIVVWCEGL